MKRFTSHSHLIYIIQITWHFTGIMDIKSPFSVELPICLFSFWGLRVFHTLPLCRTQPPGGEAPYLVTADGEQNVLLGDFEAGAEHGLEVGLIAVLPKARHLPSTGHLHTQHHISPGQPREGELGHLWALG